VTDRSIPVQAVIFDVVIFDMDGLMLDTEPLYRQAWQQAAAACGYSLSDLLYSHLIGRTRLEGEQILQTELGSAFPLDRFQEACRKFERIALEVVPLPKKPGLDALLEFLEARHITIAVATSTTRDIAIPQLMAAGLLKRFDTVITGDEVLHGKPAPDMFLLAARRLGRDPKACLVLEDSEAGVMAACRAGMPVYMVPDMLSPSTATRRAATGVFDSLKAVELELSQIGEPVRNPGRGENHVGEVGAPIVRLAPRVISRDQPKSPKDENRNHEPIIEGREDHERHPSAGHSGNSHD
jgi:HAD superfamily hydrolase (TIGR01509 family)